MFETHEKEVKATAPIFSSRGAVLFKENLVESDSLPGLYSNLCYIYITALLNATVEAIGGKILPVFDSATPESSPEGGHLFVRDPVVVLPEEQLMLYTPGNHGTGALDLADTIRKTSGYTAENISGAYFEGGNIFYASLEKEKVLLHGTDPTPNGRYFKSYGCRRKETPQQTNKILANILAPRGISVIGLELNPIIKEQEKLHNAYFHLDCYMQLLPDNRLVILNKNIISKASQQKLEEIFGSKLIDLAYEGYLSEPVLFNFLSIPINNKIYALSSFLPAGIIQSLKNLQIQVIVPDTLDPTSPHYEKEFAEKVALKLQEEGYSSATEESLIHRIPQKTNGYLADDGTTVSYEEINAAINSFDDEGLPPLDELFSNWFKEHGFSYGGGGPHCLFGDIAPNPAPVQLENTVERTNRTHREEKNGCLQNNSTSAYEEFVRQEILGVHGFFPSITKKLNAQDKMPSIFCCTLL